MKKKEIVVASTDTIALISPKDLQEQMDMETQKRKLITQFIKDHLKNGVDYGKIHVNKNCPNKYNCTNPYHFSKDTLFKPGAEKFGSLFKLRAESKKDDETWEMLGRPAGTVCYNTQLYTTKNVLVGEGKGAASVSEKGSPNTAIKIAKKRSFVDAVLSTGALSDFFTQDLEDMKETEPEVEDITPVVEYESEPETKPKEVSDTTKIAYLCEKIEIKLIPNDKEGNKAKIRAITGLEMVEKNYKEIINRLETVVFEREEENK